MSEIYEIVHKGKHSTTGQEIINRYHYWEDAEYTPILADCQILAQSFETVVWPAIQAVVSTLYVSESVTVTSISEEIEAISNATQGQGGARPGDGSPAQLPWSIKLQRSTTKTKSGGKRYSPISRIDVTPEGLPATSEIGTLLDDLAARLAVPLTRTMVSWDVYPIIWGRFKNHLPVSIINPIAYGVVKRATSQVTRQFGRGA